MGKALLFSLTAPWRGPLHVSGHPLDVVIRDLDSGFFRGQPQAAGAVSTPRDGGGSAAQTGAAVFTPRIADARAITSGLTR